MVRRGTMMRLTGLMILATLALAPELGAETEKTRVAVLPFDAPGAGRVAALGVSQHIVGRLLELGRVHVVPLSDVEKTLKKTRLSKNGGQITDETLGLVAKRYGCDAVIYGEILLRAGGRRIVRACVFDVASARTIGRTTVNAEDEFVMRLELNRTLHPSLVQWIPLRTRVVERLDRRTVRLDGGWLDGFQRWQALRGSDGVLFRIFSLTNESALATTVSGAEPAPEAGAILVRTPTIPEQEKTEK